MRIAKTGEVLGQSRTDPVADTAREKRKPRHLFLAQVGLTSILRAAKNELSACQSSVQMA